MKNLLEKLNYKGQKRIAVINAEEVFFNLWLNQNEIMIDRKLIPDILMSS